MADDTSSFQLLSSSIVGNSNATTTTTATTAAAVEGSETATTTTTTTSHHHWWKLAHELVNVCLQESSSSASSSSSSNNNHDDDTIASGNLLGIWAYLQYELSKHYSNDDNDDDNNVDNNNETRRRLRQKQQIALLHSARDACLIVLQQQQQQAKEETTIDRENNNNNNNPSIFTNPIIGAYTLLTVIYNELRQPYDGRDYLRLVLAEWRKICLGDGCPNMSLWNGQAGALQGIFFLRRELSSPMGGSELVIQIMVKQLLLLLRRTNNNKMMAVDNGMKYGWTGIYYTFLGIQDEEWDAIEIQVPNAKRDLHAMLVQDYVANDDDENGNDDWNDSSWETGMAGRIMLLLRAYQVYGNSKFYHRAMQMINNNNHERILAGDWKMSNNDDDLSLSKGIVGIIYALRYMMGRGQDHAQVVTRLVEHAVQNWKDRIQREQQFRGYGLFDGLGGLAMLLMDMAVANDDDDDSIGFPFLHPRLVPAATFPRPSAAAAATDLSLSKDDNNTVEQQQQQQTFSTLADTQTRAERPRDAGQVVSNQHSTRLVADDDNTMDQQQETFTPAVKAEGPSDAGQVSIPNVNDSSPTPTDGKNMVVQKQTFTPLETTTTTTERLKDDDAGQVVSISQQHGKDSPPLAADDNTMDQQQETFTPAVKTEVPSDAGQVSSHVNDSPPPADGNTGEVLEHLLTSEDSGEPSRCLVDPPLSIDDNNMEKQQSLTPTSNASFLIGVSQPPPADDDDDKMGHPTSTSTTTVKTGSKSDGHESSQIEDSRIAGDAKMEQPASTFTTVEILDGQESSHLEDSQPPADDKTNQPASTAATAKMIDGQDSSHLDESRPPADYKTEQPTSTPISTVKTGRLSDGQGSRHLEDSTPADDNTEHQNSNPADKTERPSVDRESSHVEENMPIADDTNREQRTSIPADTTERPSDGQDSSHQDGARRADDNKEQQQTSIATVEVERLMSNGQDSRHPDASRPADDKTKQQQTSTPTAEVGHLISEESSSCSGDRPLSLDGNTEEQSDCPSDASFLGISRPAGDKTEQPISTPTPAKMDSQGSSHLDDSRPADINTEQQPSTPTIKKGRPGGGGQNSSPLDGTRPADEEAERQTLEDNAQTPASRGATTTPYATPNRSFHFGSPTASSRQKSSRPTPPSQRMSSTPNTTSKWMLPTAMKNGNNNSRSSTSSLSPPRPRRLNAEDNKDAIANHQRRDLNARLARRTADKCFEITDSGGNLLTGGLGVRVFLRLKLNEAIPQDKISTLTAVLREAEKALEVSENRSGVFRVSLFTSEYVGAKSLCIAALYQLDRVDDAYSHATELLRKLDDECEKLPAEDCDVMNGRAGALKTIWFLREQLNDPAFGRDFALKTSQHILIQGMIMAKKHNSKSLLMWEWKGKAYLGAAHGVAGILHTLLGHSLEEWEILGSVLPRVKDVVLQAIECLEGCCHKSGNLRKKLDGEEDDECVHLAHGSPGHCLLLTRAAEVFPVVRHEFIKLAREKAETVIEPTRAKCVDIGLMRGLSGYGYVFLSLARLDDSQYSSMWFSRAEEIAHYATHELESLISHSRRPYSLFEGIGGLASLLLDLMDPEASFLPFFETRPQIVQMMRDGATAFTTESTF
eukprot:scaffold7572_cov118-Cylindrotheca_fusiformis.AAC.2